jgi:hypothetical protein
VKTNLKKFASWLVPGMIAVGCGTPPPPAVEEVKSYPRCTATEYLAFDPNNHAPQDLRLAKIDEMLALFAEAQTTPADAAVKAAAIISLYEGTDAQLASKVAGRKDVHLVGDQAAVGVALDQTIRAAITELQAATTKVQVQIAKQKFEKAGLNRWLYLSIMQELYEPSLKHYDEAFGYLGTGATNAEAARKSFARIATKRDGNNATTLTAELFASLNDGACALEKALDAKAVTSMKKDDDADYAQVVQQLDDKLQLVVAYSVGHEFFEIKNSGSAALVQLYEADGYFQIIEPYLTAAGGAKAQLATDLRTALNAALVKAAADDTSWATDLNSIDPLGKLEAALSIDVKG